MTHITLPRAVVEQALEALKHSRTYADVDNAITTLRAALEASKEVEPVAWMTRDEPLDDDDLEVKSAAWMKRYKGTKAGYFYSIPLYTHAPVVPEEPEWLTGCPRCGIDGNDCDCYDEGVFVPETSRQFLEKMLEVVGYAGDAARSRYALDLVISAEAEIKALLAAAPEVKK